MNTLFKMATLQNVVCTAMLNSTFHFKAMDLDKLKNATLNQSKLKSLILRDIQGTTCLLYQSGKVVCNKSKSVEKSKDAVKFLAEKINAIYGYQCQVSDFKVANMVASSKLGFRIRLHEIHASHMQSCFWDQENFAPGLRYRFKDLGITLTAFPSGKMYVTGAKSWAPIETAFERFQRMAIRHKSI